MVQARAASAGAAGESGGNGDADDDSSRGELKVEGDGVGQAQGQASRAGLLHKVHRHKRSTARESAASRRVHSSRRRLAHPAPSWARSIMIEAGAPNTRTSSALPRREARAGRMLDGLTLRYRY